MKKVIAGLVLLAALIILAISVFASQAGATTPCVDVLQKTVTYDFKTRDNGMNGIWAVDTFHSKVEIYSTVCVSSVRSTPKFRVVRTDEGTFETIAAKSPGGDGTTTVSAGVKGDITGGETTIVSGELLRDIPGYVYRDWSETERPVPYYEPFFNSEKPRGEVQEWGWTYKTCNNGTWVDTPESEASYPGGDIMGDITGNYIPCTQPEPEKKADNFSAPGPAGAPMCQGTTPAMIPNAFAHRINATSALVAYWPTITGGQVNIRYREVGATGWQHALRDYPNLGLAPIGFLKENVKYEYQLTNGHGCAQSNWSPVFKSL
jgi:hypothetical protein